MAAAQSLPAGAISVWPTMPPGTTIKRASGYRCELFNRSPELLSNLRMEFPVTFRAKGAEQLSYRIRGEIPGPLEPQSKFVLYVADDTGWSPVVQLPTHLTSRIGDDTAASDIPIRYPTDGRPTSLRGFEPSRVRPMRIADAPEKKEGRSSSRLQTSVQ
jgi:hypothetical protein